MVKKKIIILGIDALNFNILTPLISDGTLPNFQDLKDRSAYSVMNSIIPSVTGPAWTTINTGKNPGKHGIFDFVRIEDGRSKMNKRSDIDGEFFFDTLSKMGKKCIVMSVPFTYPPSRWFKGVAVSDFLHRDVRISDERSSHLIDDYRVVPNEKLKGPALSADMLSITKRQVQLCKELMWDREWDVAFFYFGMLDSFSHHFFDKVGTKSLEWEHGKCILKTFDELIGEMLSKLGKDYYFLVISDHGFRCYPHTIYLNRILENQGYLLRSYSLDNGRTGSFQGYRSVIGNILKLPILHQLAKFAYWAIGSLFKRSSNTKWVGITEDIDFVNSIAFTPTTESMGIMIRSSAMKPLKSKESLLRYLGSLEHQGKRVFNRIVPREEIYSGDHLANSPDYILFSEDFMINANIHGKELFGDKYFFHDIDAVFFLVGSGVKVGLMKRRPDLQDVAPTVLSLLGISPPEDMDGRFLENAFTELPSAGSTELDRIRKAALKFKGKGPQSR